MSFRIKASNKYLENYQPPKTQPDSYFDSMLEENTVPTQKPSSVNSGSKSGLSVRATKSALADYY